MLARVKLLSAGLVSPEMRKRLGAWWRGDSDPSEEGAPERRSAKTDDEDGLPDWLMVAEQLWGTGALGPGEGDFMCKLALGLNPTADKTMAYFGIGLGGAARRLVEETDVWIVGYESDPDAVALGVEQCRRAGRSKKVAINHVDYDFLRLPKEKFHGAIAKESFHDVPDKARVFARISQALRGRGSFLFTDYVVTADPLDAGTCTALFGKRLAPVSPCSTATYLELLTSNDFELRVNEDLTGLYIGFITEGWRNLHALLDNLRTQAGTPVRRMHFLRALTDEAAMWAYRLEALRTRKLEVRRFLGLKRYRPNIVR